MSYKSHNNWFSSICSSCHRFQTIGFVYANIFQFDIHFVFQKPNSQRQHTFGVNTRRPTNMPNVWVHFSGPLIQWNNISYIMSCLHRDLTVHTLYNHSKPGDTKRWFLPIYPFHKIYIASAIFKHLMPYDQAYAEIQPKLQWREQFQTSITSCFFGLRKLWVGFIDETFKVQGGRDKCADFCPSVAIV